MTTGDVQYLQHKAIVGSLARLVFATAFQIVVTAERTCGVLDNLELSELSASYIANSMLKARVWGVKHTVRSVRGGLFVADAEGAAADAEGAAADPEDEFEQMMHDGFCDLRAPHPVRFLFEEDELPADLGPADAAPDVDIDAESEGPADSDGPDDFFAEPLAVAPDPVPAVPAEPPVPEPPAPEPPAPVHPPHEFYWLTRSNKQASCSGCKGKILSHTFRMVR